MTLLKLLSLYIIVTLLLLSQKDRFHTYHVEMPDMPDISVPTFEMNVPQFTTGG